MYIPAHFAAADLDQVARFVDQAGTADLVTFDGTAPASTLLPVIWERPDGWAERIAAGGQVAGEAGGAAGTWGAPEDGDGAGGSRYGRLIGHIALSNPQWSIALPGVPGLAIVRGPQAYVSPSWYESTREHGRTVPTWNYTTVHLTGEVRFHRDESWLREVVTRLTERYEAGRTGRWWVADAPEKFIAGQLRAIVGVELLIAKVEAKDKLSQNRPPQDRANVIAALRAEPGAGPRAIADLMAGREAG